jgi:hypothetical protein
MDNKKLLKQYAETGAILPEYQLERLSKNLRGTYFKRRLAQAGMDITRHSIKPYEVTFMPRVFQVQLAKTKIPLNNYVFKELSEDCRIIHYKTLLDSNMGPLIPIRLMPYLPKEYQKQYFKGGLVSIREFRDEFEEDIISYYLKERFDNKTYSFIDVELAPKDLLNQAIERGDDLDHLRFQKLPQDLRDKYIYLRIKTHPKEMVGLDYFVPLSDKMKKYVVEKKYSKGGVPKQIFIELPEDYKITVLDRVINNFEEVGIQDWQVKGCTSAQQKKLLDKIKSAGDYEFRLWRYFDDGNQFLFFKWLIDSEKFDSNDLAMVSAPALKMVLEYLSKRYDGGYEVDQFLYMRLDSKQQEVFMDYVVKHAFRIRDGHLWHAIDSNGLMSKYAANKYTPLPKDIKDLDRNEINRLPDDKYVATLRALGDIQHPFLIKLLEDFTDWPRDKAYDDDRRDLLKIAMSYTKETIKDEAFFRNEDLAVEYYSDWVRKGNEIPGYVKSKMSKPLLRKLVELGVIKE